MDVVGNHEYPALPPVFWLAAFQVSLEEGSIAGPDGGHRLEPRVFAVLLYLVTRHGHVVSREDLFSQVWSGVVVGDDALHYSISQIRKLFGDDARHPRFLQTLPRRGYRWLVAPSLVEPSLVEPSSLTAPAPAETGSAPEPDSESGSASEPVASPSTPITTDTTITTITTDTSLRHHAWPAPNRAVWWVGLFASALLVTGYAVWAALSAAPPTVPPRLQAGAEQEWQIGVRLLRRRSPDGLQGAAAAFQRGLDIQPNAVPLWAGLAEALALSAYYQTPDDAPRQLAAARQAADQAVSLDPASADALASRGQVALVEGELESARYWLERAGTLQPHHVATQHGLAEYAFGRGRYSQARDAIRRALTIDPLEPVLHDTAGLIARRTGDAAEARTHFEQALKIEPAMPGPHRSLAALAMAEGRWEDALSHFQQALASGYRRPGGYLDLAALLWRLGEREQSARWQLAAREMSLAQSRGIQAGLLQLALLQWADGAPVDEQGMQAETLRILSLWRGGNDLPADDSGLLLDLELLATAQVWPIAALAAHQQTEQPAVAAGLVQRLRVGVLLLPDRATPARYLLKAQLAALDGAVNDVWPQVGQALTAGWLDLERLQSDPVLGPHVRGREQEPLWRAAVEKRQHLRARLHAEARKLQAPVDPL